MGRQVVRDIPSDSSVEELCAANKLNLYDPDLEHKLFPHLYPHGVGGYAPNPQRCGTDADAPATKRLTLGLYIKMRLLHADPRWRHDRLWPFFAYDCLMKSRIVAYNLKCPKSAAAVQGRPAPMSKNFWEVRPHTSGLSKAPCVLCRSTGTSRTFCGVESAYLAVPLTTGRGLSSKTGVPCMCTCSSG